ncbi:MAG: hypothetical protein KGD68_12285 [Candidatus Lokiarchaeota archaeon]|nr:hypothetical protein [Candidatus Lokiarchaeota archaeon]
MTIKCKDCGIEYSYGRNIWHACGDNILLFGAIFEEERSERKWNCVSINECIENSLEESELPESFIEVFPKI